MNNFQTMSLTFYLVLLNSNSSEELFTCLSLWLWFSSQVVRPILFLKPSTQFVNALTQWYLQILFIAQWHIFLYQKSNLKFEHILLSLNHGSTGYLCQVILNKFVNIFTERCCFLAKFFFYFTSKHLHWFLWPRFQSSFWWSLPQ